MGLNFFSDKFSIKSTFLKEKGRYIHQNRFAYVNIFTTFIACTFFIDKLSLNTVQQFENKLSDSFWAKNQCFYSKAMIFCTKWWLKAPGIAQNCHILVFFHGFRRGKDDLRMRKGHFDAVFFLSATPRVGESPTRRVEESFFYCEYR